MNIERSRDGVLINPLTLLGNGEFTPLCPDTCLSKRMVLHVAIHIYFWNRCGSLVVKFFISRLKKYIRFRERYLVIWKSSPWLPCRIEEAIPMGSWLMPFKVQYPNRKFLVISISSWNSSKRELDPKDWLTFKRRKFIEEGNSSLLVSSYFLLFFF